MKEVILLPEKTGKYVPCDYCGKIIYKTLSQYNKRVNHYCSNKCQAMKKRELTFEHRAYEVCGGDIYASKRSTQRFCSQKCQNSWQRNNIGFNNKRFRGGYVLCENCGKSFLVGQNIYESDRHHFCSTPCRRQWYSNTWSQSGEWKELSRKRAVQLLAENKISTQTKPQLVVNDILDRLQIIYTNEEPFLYYSIDNYLKEYGLAIEVMGDYWHGSPLKYANRINDKQKHIISRDKAKHTYLKNKYGIEILYLWESDIYDNPALCEFLILKYIEQKGILENYNSFNYELHNNEVVLKSEIIKPYQERKIAC